MVHSHVSQLAPKEVRNVTWFDFSLDTPGEYVFTLFVNGTPVDDKTITVKPEGNVMAWMECNSPVQVESSTTCVVHLKNYGSQPIEVSLEEIHFAGVTIWNGVDDESVRIPVNATKTAILRSNSTNNDIRFEITLNNRLAEKLFDANYFLSPGGGYYTYLLTPNDQPAAYRVSAVLSIGQSVSFGVLVTPNTRFQINGYTITSNSLTGLGIVLAFMSVDFGTVVTIAGFILNIYPNIRAPAPLGANETYNNLIGGG